MSNNNEDKNIFYVYIYLDPRKPGNYVYGDGELMLAYEPFYVGKGHGNRSNNHLKDTKSRRPFYDKLHSLLKQGFTPIVEIIKSDLEESESFEVEHNNTVKLIGTRFDLEYKGPLLNMNLGGRGGISPSPEVRAKSGVQNIGRFTGKNNGNYLNACNNRGEKNGFYKKKHTTKTRAKMRRDYVIMLMTGEWRVIEDIQIFCRTYGFPLSKLIDACGRQHAYRNMRIGKYKNVDEIPSVVERLKTIQLNQNKGGRNYEDLLSFELLDKGESIGKSGIVAGYLG